MAREESPLPRDVDLARLLAGLPAQRRPSLDKAVWIENGREVTLDAHDRAAPSTKTRKSDDPVLRFRRLLQDKVQPLGDYTQAVLFPNEGGSDAARGRESTGRLAAPTSRRRAVARRHARDRDAYNSVSPAGHEPTAAWRAAVRRRRRTVDHARLVRV
jgi:hypothetical protein